MIATCLNKQTDDQEPHGNTKNGNTNANTNANTNVNTNSNSNGFFESDFLAGQRSNNEEGDAKNKNRGLSSQERKRNIIRRYNVGL